MFRVTTGMLKNTMMYNLKSAQRRLDVVQNQVATGKKASMPHQDPAGVTNSMLYKSRITEIDQFIDNTGDANSRMKFYDTALESTGDILKRLKSLTVQAANGTYNDHDRKMIAMEIDSLLNQMLVVANTKYKDENIFSGFQTTTEPFKVSKEMVKGYSHALINKVKYVGDIGKQKREVEEQKYIKVNFAGNSVFWGRNGTITSSTAGTNWKSTKEQVFRIDGLSVNVATGDTLPVVVQKINNLNTSVKASINNTKGANLLVLETTDPHQMWVEDIQGGSVMQDLGVIGMNDNLPPNNISSTAKVHGGSIFDQVIDLRNSLLSNNLDKIGTKNLGEIDAAIRHISRYRGEVGATSSRLKSVEKRLMIDKVNMISILSRTEDVDIAEAVTNLKMLEYVRQAAMQVGARIIPKTLMDFLR